MKVITTNRLNRFWKNGVKPIKDALANKLNTSSIVNNLLTTAAGYALDARQGKALDDKITALNGKLTDTGWQNLANGRVSYRVKNGWCIVNASSIGHLTLTNAANGSTNASQATLIATLPAAARPTQMLRINGTARDNTGYDPQFDILATGEIRGRLNKASGSINTWAFTAAYPV